MAKDPRVNDRIRSVLVMLATTATIAFHSLESAGKLSTPTTGNILERYATVITPAGFALSIWSLIFLGLASYSVYQLLPGNLTRFSTIRTPYIVSCVLACGWIYSWHHERMGWAVVLASALTALLLSLAAKFRKTITPMETWTVKATFGIYAGWMAAAAVVDLFIWFAASGMAAATSSAFGIVAVVVLTAAVVLATWRFSNYFFPLPVAWGLTAVAVQQSGNTAIVAACAFCVIICLVAASSFVLTLPSRTPQRNEDE